MVGTGILRDWRRLIANVKLTLFFPAFLALQLSYAPVRAQEIYQARLIDTVPGSAAYFLVFSAFGGSATGHLNVGWGKESPDLLSSVDEGCFGYYSPQTWAQFTFSSVEGRLRSCPSGDAGLTRRFIVQVPLADYNASLQVMLRWRKRTEYQLYNADCVTFGAEVAISARLKAPDRSLIPPRNVFPDEFLKSLVALNGGRKGR